MNKPKQFKIEIPSVITVESDTDNHLVDIFSVIIVVVSFFIMTKVLRRWVK
tara:strand:- start:549 stop:701 length:153 start_codon:yes stop_codon:yes gene_type:complete